MAGSKTRRDLWRDTARRVKKIAGIHRSHTLSVISILMDELGKELLDKNMIEITNLGTFELIRIKPRNVISVVSRRVKLARETRVLRFRLAKSFKEYLIDKGKVK